MNRRIPVPAPRRVRKLPIAAIIVGSVAGIGLFLFLWNVAINLQEERLPQPQGGQWQAP